MPGPDSSLKDSLTLSTKLGHLTRSLDTNKVGRAIESLGSKHCGDANLWIGLVADKLNDVGVYDSKYIAKFELEPRVIGFFRDSDAVYVQDAAAWALGRAGSEAGEHHEALMKKLIRDWKSMGVRGEELTGPSIAAWALGKIGGDLSHARSFLNSELARIMTSDDARYIANDIKQMVLFYKARAAIEWLVHLRAFQAGDPPDQVEVVLDHFKDRRPHLYEQLIQLTQYTPMGEVKQKQDT